MEVTKKLISISLALFICLGCFPVFGLAEGTETSSYYTEVPDGYVGIYTKDDLDNIKLNMSGKYILMNDIIFNDSDFVKGGSFYNSGKGWEPIGTTSTKFTGVLDGNGFKICNLYINNPTQNYIGLFGYVYDGIIKNLAFEDATIIGNDNVGLFGYVFSTAIENIMSKNTNINGNKYVGGVVGYSDYNSSVSYCDVHGAISGVDFVGGIVGYQNAPANLYTNHNYIKCCNNSSSINARKYVGGIVGFSSSNCDNSDSYPLGYSRVYYCSNSGSVTAADLGAGGIVGWAKGSTLTLQYTEYCYNSGDVSALSRVGGIVGDCGSAVQVDYCYSVGKIIGKSDFGGCFGTKPLGVAFCYYLDEGVIEPTCKFGIAKSEDQLKKITTYEQWDFTTIWTIDGKEEYPYPELIDAPEFKCNENSHKHSYTSKITKPASHTETGIKTFTCVCGDNYTETIEKIVDHSYVSVVTAPTCTEQGFTTHSCECGDSYVDNYIIANGHTEVIDEEKDPTCKIEGKTEGSHCSVCKAVINAQIAIPTIAHEPSSWIIDNEPTCNKEGSKHTECTVCGAVVETASIPVVNHNYSTEWTVDVVPSCNEEGSKSHHCIVCDNKTDITPIAASGEHIASNWIVEKQSTCTSNGYKYKQCTVCGKKIQGATTYALGHIESNWFIEEQATCTTNGLKYKQCLSCGEKVEVAVLYAFGHTSSDWKTDKKATVNAAGEKHKECDVCGEVIEAAKIAQLKCSKPTLKSIENTEYGVLTKWGKVSGADKYYIYRKTSKGSYSRIGSTTNTYYTDKTAKSGTKYYYIVKAINEAGGSVSSSALSRYYLADPTLNTPSSTTRGVGLRWSEVAGAQGYMVYRRTVDGSYTRIKTEKGISNVTFRDTTAQKGTKYYYKVKAYYSKTYSAYSNTKTITDKY